MNTVIDDVEKKKEEATQAVAEQLQKDLAKASDSEKEALLIKYREQLAAITAQYEEEKKSRLKETKTKLLNERRQRLTEMRE